MTAPLDPYGIDLAIDPGGDLRVTHSGALGAVGGAANCSQAVFLRLKTPLGDLALHPDFGSMLAGRLIGAKTQIGGLISQLNSELRTMLSEDPRFATAAVVQAQQPAAAGKPDSTQFGVQATLSGGEQLVLSNTADPSSADISVPQPIDPSSDPSVTYDPLTEQEFFADQSEFDTLQDLDAQQWLVDNTAVNTGTGG